MSGINIIEPSAPEHFEDVRRLFKEYLDFLFEQEDIGMNMDLKQTDIDLKEVDDGTYAAPHGAIVLAQQDGQRIGVVALRRWDDEICEMKRLYVQPAYRGLSVGRLIGEEIIRKGRELGYKKMRLDTHPAMKGAHKLYYSLGFYEIERYNKNMVPGALFMEKELL